MGAPFIQSVLHPAGVQAARIEHLWWILFWVCSVVFVAVVLAIGIAAVRGRRGTSTASDATAARSVAIAVGLSIVALLVLLTEGELTGRGLGSLREQGTNTNALRIQITGNQWWWDVQYLNPNTSLIVTTANEIHIPVGRPVGIVLKSNDVIHSLWIPALHGKRDLVPGRENEIWMQADRAGFYRGQCAEFCGLQHAKMALSVVADLPDDFERWLMQMRSSAPAPTTPSATHGKEVIERGPCAMCHTIVGTMAGGRTAPDLTHVASRSSIGAGAVPNTRGNLAGWIADPQHIKPGNHMPATGLTSEELQAVLDYLETLK